MIPVRIEMVSYDERPPDNVINKVETTGSTSTAPWSVGPGKAVSVSASVTSCKVSQAWY